MALRSMISRTALGGLLKADVTLRSATSVPRCFSSSSGRVFDEEERAAEHIYIKKMERERLEKKLKLEKAKAEKEKSDQKSDGDAKAESK